MLRCPQCQTEHQDNARICRECGSQLAAAAASRSAARLTGELRTTAATCPSCGASAPAGAQFCLKCGKNLTGVEYASFWRRLGGYLLDVIIIFVGTVIVSLIIQSALGSLISFLAAITYYVVLNANGGTLGKRALGIRLEKAETGEDIGYPSALVRYIVAIFSGLALLLGYLWCIWDSRNQTWHDKAAGSVVVRA